MSAPILSPGNLSPTLRTRRRAATTGLTLVVLVLAIPLLPGAAGLVAGPLGAGHAPSGASLAASAAPPVSPSSSPALPNGLTLARIHQPVTNLIAGLEATQAAGLSGARSAAPASPLLSTANNVVRGTDCASFGVFTPFEPTPFAGESIVTAGSNTTLLVASGSTQGVFNSSGGSLCNAIAAPSSYYGSHGNTMISRSTDGGQTWATTWLRQNTTHWLNPSAATNGTVNWGQPQLAIDSSGVALASELALPNCWFNFTSYPNHFCNSNATYEEPWSIAVARSGDAGLTWGVPAQIATAQAVQWVNVTSNCIGVFTSGSGLYFDSIPEHATVAINPVNGVAIVTWDVVTITFDMTTCTTPLGATSFASVSTDGGVTWGAPVVLANAFAEYPVATIGPAPTYAITVFYDDAANFTGGATSWGATTSTDNGSTWGLPRPILLDSVNFVSGLAGLNWIGSVTFLGLTIPQAAVDSGSSSSFKGNEYVVWSDNQTGGSAGTPAIDLILKSAGSSGWTSPTTISTGGLYYFQPTVSIDPAGTVFVSYYGYSTGSSSYSLYGIYSTDGGLTWSHQFRITDQASSPPTNWADGGVWAGGVSTSNGAYPAWIDCRTAACSSTYDDQVYVANPHLVTLNSNIAGVNATVTTFGTTSTYGLPTSLGWDNSSVNTVAVPQFLPDPSNSSDVYSFQSFTGAATSTNNPATLTYTGGAGTLTANYVAVQAAVLKGTIGPNVPGLSLKLGASPVALLPYNNTALQYSISVPGGLSYTLTASAPNYQTQTNTVPTATGGTYYWNVTLTKRVGYFVGQLTPASATLTINGTVVTTVNQVTGLFSVPEPFGSYWVNATGTGLTSFHQYLSVTAGLNTTVNIVLIGGWIQGVVLGAQPTKPGLVVKLDGIPIAVSAAGTFNNSTLGGFHTLSATQAGYNLSAMSVFVSAGHTTLVNVTLTNRGWISGLVAPSDAVKTAVLHIYSGSTGNYYNILANGSFNVSLLGGLNYTVNVSATNYYSFETHVLVTPGNGSSVPVTLTAKPTGCTGPNCNQPPGGGTNGSGSGISTTTLILIVVVIVVVAAVAVVLLMRRRGGGGAPQAAEEEGQSVYQESNPADLPRLQSDGTMGPGNPPPPTG